MLGVGIGKGTGKRHRKVLRDNIQGITKPAIRRLARRGGVKRINGLVYEETRGVLKVFLENVIRDAVAYTEHARRKTVTHMDVLYALKRDVNDGRKAMYFGTDPSKTDAEARSKAKPNSVNASSSKETASSSNSSSGEVASSSNDLDSAFKVSLICNNTTTRSWTKKMMKDIGSKHILLDCIIDPQTIFINLKAGFEIVATPEPLHRNKQNFISAEAFSTEALLRMMGYKDQQSDDVKNLMLIAGTIVMAYHRNLSTNSDKPTIDTLKEYAQEWDDVLYTEVMKSVFKKWDDKWINNCVNNMKTKHVLASDPPKKTKTSPYDNYFSCSLTMRYTKPAPPYSNPKLEESLVTAYDKKTKLPKTSKYNLTLDVLKSCNLKEDQPIVDASNAVSNTGIRSELNLLQKYSEKYNKNVYLNISDNKFWVAVEM